MSREWAYELIWASDNWSLPRTSEDSFLVFRIKLQNEMVFSSSILVYSFEAQNCIRLKMKPILGEGKNQENYREIESVQLDYVNPKDPPHPLGIQVSEPVYFYIV